jgi:predicted metalloendopeptidase
MKVKLSPFTILFLLLNSILIFCASRKIDSEKKPSSSLTNTTTDTHVKASDNFNAYANSSWVKKTKIAADKSSADIGFIINDRSDEGVKNSTPTSTKDDFAKDSH